MAAPPTDLKGWAQQYLRVLREDPGNSEYMSYAAQCISDIDEIMEQSTCSEDSLAELQRLKDQLEERLRDSDMRYTQNPTTTTVRAAISSVIDAEGRLDKDQVKIERLLSSSGCFGDVFQATYAGMHVAVKMLKREKLKDGWFERFDQERADLSRLRHKNICQYLGYVEEPLMIVMEYCPLTLRVYLERPNRPVEQKLRISFELAGALSYLSSKGILHRDVKCENIFLDSDLTVKLADFGLSEYISGPLCEPESPGTPLYLAPEVVNHKTYDLSCEVYTYGLVLYEIFTQETVFPEARDVEDLKKLQLRQPMLPLPPEAKGDDTGMVRMWSLIQKCYSYNPADRPSFNQIMKSVNEIGVRRSIPNSKSSQKHWMACTHYCFKDRIDLSDFASNSPFVDRHIMAETVAHAAPPTWSLLHINHFNLLCCWFPMFWKKKTAFKNMNEVVSSQWYARSENEAAERLSATRSMPIAGSHYFVVRPSEKEPLGAPFTLCLVGSRKHIRRSMEKSTNLTIYSCDFTEGERNTSLLQLVKSLIERHSFVPAGPLTREDVLAMYDD